jgi:hypothetical protein
VKGPRSRTGPAIRPVGRTKPLKVATEAPAPVEAPRGAHTVDYGYVTFKHVPADWQLDAAWERRWPNFETWVASLWMASTDAQEAYRKDQARAAGEEDDPVDLLAEVFRSEMEAAFTRVDWQRLATVYLKEVDVL